MKARGKKILFCLSGSIAAIKAAQVISRLVQDGFEVQTVCTPSALRFIGAATLEGLTGKRVLSELWEEGHAMDHIHLTRWADQAILCPASATTIARLAHGLAEDLVSALALAWPHGTDKPFYIFPAMNAVMFEAAVTQDNLRRLTAHGFHVEAVASGSLACGETGAGRLSEPEEILMRLRTAAASRASPDSRGPGAAPRGRILVTAGATREPIDGIRFISNVSTGQTGAALADRFSERGWHVTYLHGVGAARPNHPCERQEFSGFNDLENQLRHHLSGADFAAVIHAAAVADFSVDGATTDRKLSGSEALTLQLRPNRKLLPRLKEYSRDKNIRVFGFKLLFDGSGDELVREGRKVLTESVDGIVANGWHQVAADRAQHPGLLLTKTNGPLPFSTLDELANALEGEVHGSVS